MRTLHLTQGGSVPTQVSQGVSIHPTSPWDPQAQHPSLNRVQSEPTNGPSRFTYDANATTQHYNSQQHFQGDELPPPYNQVANQNIYQVHANFPEKPLSAATPSAMFQQST
jgi:hypothetical protein